MNMNRKREKNSRSKAVIGLLLLAVLVITGCSGKKGNEEKNPAEEQTFIALAGTELSESFAQNPHPLYARNDFEYRLGLLFAPSLMYQDENGQWQSGSGSITLSTEGENTVAVVKINDGVKYYNGSYASGADYIGVLKKIANCEYQGYFDDFYKNPIEGLVAYRYQCAGLELKDVPDFEKEADKLFESLTKEDYRNMLLKTDLAGLYPAGCTPQDQAPDGRTFRQVVEEDSRTDEEKNDEFFTKGNVAEKMLEELSGIYAMKGRNEWFIPQLRAIEVDKLQQEFLQECRSQGRPVDSISGVEGTDIHNGKAMSVRITFTGNVEKEQAYRMLNLPLLPGVALSEGKGITGTGTLKYAGCYKSGNSYALRVANKEGKRFTLLPIEEKNIISTMYMKQLCAASYTPTEQERAQIEEQYGLKLLTVSGRTVVYHPELITPEQIQSFAALFTL